MRITRKITPRRLYTFFILVICITAAFGIYQFRKNQDYSNYISNQNSRAFHELSNYVENVEVSLAKAMLVNNPKTLGILASEIWREAAFAQANLGQLPISHIQLDKTSKFLTQVGDFCYSISRNEPYTDEVDEKDLDKIEKLHNYAEKLSSELNSIQSEFNKEKLVFQEISQQGSKFFKQVKNVIPDEKFSNIEKEFIEYPTLIYDGPFSEHIEKMVPKMLKDKKEITKDEAQKKAVKFLGINRSQGIKYSGEGNGKIKTYQFQIEKGSDRITIDVTKKGGYILWMLDNKRIDRSNIKYNEAVSKAEEFLKNNDFKNMVNTYYETSGNIVTINFAYKKNDIIMYPDLIKVKISLDDGEVVGFESKGYLMSHEDNRKLPEIIVTQEEAKNKINSRLEVEGVNLSVIPLESKREVLCYEFSGTYKEKDFLIYINVESGIEERILMIIKSPNGYLTI